MNVPALPLKGERMNLDFSSTGFRPVTMEERISKYRAMAEEAMMLAYGGDYETREEYLILANQWTELAHYIVPMWRGRG